MFVSEGLYTGIVKLVLRCDAQTSPFVDFKTTGVKKPDVPDFSDLDLMEFQASLVRDPAPAKELTPSIASSFKSWFRQPYWFFTGSFPDDSRLEFVLTYGRKVDPDGV